MDEPMDGLYFHIDELNRIMYRQFRESSIENQDFLHMWPHWFLLTAIRNTDFSLFVEIMDDIKNNIFKESTSIHFENLFQSTPYKNFFNRTLGDMYLNIVQRNGLNQFKQFLLNGGAQFNTMSNLHNKYKSFTQFVREANRDINMLTIFIEQKTRNIEVKIEVSLHIGIRWDDDIKYAYMLISKGVSTDIFDQHSMFVHFEKMRHDIVRLILAEELLNIPKEHNYHKIIQDILGKVIESPINLNVIRNTAVIDGHNVLRKLLKLQPRLINDLIMNAYQLLKISSREINNATDRSEYLQRILEHKIVCGNDGNEIFRMLQLHNIEDEEFNFFEIPMTVENYLPRLNYICILCCKLIHPCHLCSQTKRRILQERNRSRIDGNSELAKRLKVFYFNREIKFIQQEIKRNSEGHVDLLASLLNKVWSYGHYYFFIERILINLLHIVVLMNDLLCGYMLLCKAASVLIYSSNKKILDKALHLATQNGNVDMKTLILMARQKPSDINSYKVFKVFRNLQIPPIKKETLEFFLDNCGETVCLKVLKERFYDKLNYFVAKDLLYIAIRRNYCQIIREILNNFEFDSVSFDSRKSLNSFKQSIVLLGVTDGNPIVVRELLKLKPQVTDDLIINACRRLRMSDDRLECLKLILEQEHVNVRCTDDLGNTPLHYALEANNYEAALLLLKQGSYLGHMNKSKNIAIANIPAFVLSSYFNDCIQLKDEWTDKCTIEFDYRCLMPHDDLEARRQQETYQTTREMEVISYIANNDTLKHLLKHPLLSSFLYIKWYKIRHILYANFVFYMMFYFFLNVYILNMTYTTPSKSGKQITNDSSNMVFANTLESTCSQDISLWIIVVEMLLIFTGRNLLQFLFSPRHYLTDLKNWSQILLIVLTLTLLCGAGFQIAVIVILLSTWELITLISHLLPSTSTTIEMFQTVFFNFVRFFFPYMFLVLAFALVFHMLFTNDIHFSNPDLSLFKTIIMLTGEFDANDISFSVYPVWSRLVFVLFIFNMVIVLLNLLKGVAISDIAKILYKAEIIRLISQIHLIIYFERMIIGKPFCWHSRWIWRNLFNFVSGRIFLFPYFLEDGKVSFKLYDNLNVYDKDMCLNRWFSLKMDPNIIKNAKQIVCNKNNLSNDNIMDELAKLQARLAQIKRTLKRY